MQLVFETGRVSTPELLQDIELPSTISVLGQSVDLTNLKVGCCHVQILNDFLLCSYSYFKGFHTLSRTYNDITYVFMRCVWSNVKNDLGGYLIDSVCGNKYTDLSLQRPPLGSGDWLWQVSVWLT